MSEKLIFSLFLFSPYKGRMGETTKEQIAMSKVIKNLST